MMNIAINMNGYMDLSFAAFFLVLFVLFVYQTTKKNRYAPFLITSLIFGFLGGLFSFFYEIFPTTGVNFLQLLNAACYSLQVIFFYLFMENLISLKINSLRLSVALIIITIQTVASFGIVFFSKIPEYNYIKPVLLFVTIFTYDLLAIYVYFIVGVPIYMKTYRYTKEKRALLMFIALILAGIGFMISAIYKLLDFLGVNIGARGLTILSIFFYGLPLIGLFLFLLCYITDVDYLYRLPNDNYILMVTYKSGVTIHTIHFKTRFRQVEIDENLLSGLITGINMVFKSVLDSQAEVQNILSKDAAIIMESGKYISAVVVTNNVSAILDRSLKRYVKEFEKKFQVQLEKESVLISDFDSAKDLLKSIFPFLVIKE